MSILFSTVIVLNTDIPILGAWQRNKINGSVTQTFGVIPSREQSNFQNWLMHWSWIIPQASKKIPLSSPGRYPGGFILADILKATPQILNTTSQNGSQSSQNLGLLLLWSLSAGLVTDLLLHELEPIHRYGLKPGDWPKSLCPDWQQNKKKLKQGQGSKTWLGWNDSQPSQERRH